LQRVHGGALPASPAIADFAGRELLTPEGKTATGRAAATMVQQGQGALGDSSRSSGLRRSGSRSVGGPVRRQENHESWKKRPHGCHVIFRAVDEFFEAKIKLVGQASGPLHCVHAFKQVGKPPALRFLCEPSPQVVENAIERGLGALTTIWEIGVHI